jgi:hypothetical protein
VQATEAQNAETPRYTNPTRKRGRICSSTITHTNPTRKRGRIGDAPTLRTQPSLARRTRCWAAALGIVVLAAVPSQAQPPAAPGAPPAVCTRRGRLHRMFHHATHTLEDKFVGYPATFIEPPLGYYVYEQLGVQVAKADTHRFTFYRSDFLPGTNQLSPAGASRFNIMTGRIPGWLGPITVEWTPEQPDLAQARRLAIVENMKRAGAPILADRVVIAPSPYPGAMGVEAVNHFTNTVMRSQMSATATFGLPPNNTADAGVH